MPTVRSRHCPACDACWSGPQARYCGRCGTPLPPAASAGTSRPSRRRLVIALTLLLAALAALAVVLVALPDGSRTVTEPTGDRDRVELPGGAVPADGSDEAEPTAGSSLLGCEGCHGWRSALTDTVTSLRADGRDVVVATSGGSVLVLDGDTGERRWTARIGDEAAHAVVLDGLVVVGTADARVVALDPADGHTRWEVTLPIPTAGARAVAGDADGVLLAGGSGHGVVALDGQTGALRWVRELPGRTVGVGTTLVSVMPDGRLEGWWAADDEPRWSVRLLADEDLVGRAGDLVVTRDRGGPRFRDATTGAIVANGAPTVSWWAAAEDGTLVLADTGRRSEVVALAPDGAERWRTALPGDEPDADCCVEVAPTSDGRVLAVDRRVTGRAAVLDLATGAVLADAGRAAAAVPGLLLIGAHGDLGVLQGEGAVAGVALATGEVRWRTSDASVLVGLDPLVVSGRRHLLGPWTQGAGG
jgi:outer membrane protein assembly factor BamB